MTNVDEVTEAQFQFLHENSLSRAIVIIVLHALRVLNHSVINVHRLCGGIAVKQTAQSERDVKRVALDGLLCEVLDEMNHQVFFAHSG